jgi:hypothetical protein
VVVFKKGNPYTGFVKKYSHIKEMTVNKCQCDVIYAIMCTAFAKETQNDTHGIAKPDLPGIDECPDKIYPQIYPVSFRGRA